MSNKYSADCEQCFGLCCVALPYAKSSDFAFNKDGGTPCRNLQTDYRCGVHKNLRNKGFRGCTVYECFGAGQMISQVTYNGKDWRENPTLAKEMFDVFPIMQQLYEMLYYLNEALSNDDTQPIHKDLKHMVAETERLTMQDPKFLLELHVPTHRAFVNGLLLQTSELVRAKVKNNKEKNKQNKVLKGKDLIGANLRGASLIGDNLRGVLFIASDLRDADMRMTDLIGADFRDADLSGANLTGSIFLTQAQVNSANGDSNTKLPSTLNIPNHWLK
ncbi:pentapeptide repeat-containing protein [Paenibacillus crassostreae]|uniref:pentapeptide repeat-containing protein n=1 Tax=Paenibacillus crassostreae TaxID=1763538 RepID=UPI0009F72466|nr:pentapeptide repeat-containing protein [Paenibacillus crassostreae]